MPDAPAVPISDVGADISAAFDSVEGTEPDPAAEPSAPAGESQPSPEGAIADAARARDAAGRFTKAEREAQAAAAAQVSGELKIPEKWPPQVKDRLKAIHAANPEHAQFVLEQYNHFRQEAAQVANRATQQLRAFDDLLAPGRQTRALNNMDDATYVRQLIAAGDFLDKNPTEGIKYLLKNYGLTIEQLAGHQPEGGAQAEIPPYVREIQEKQARIEAALQQQYAGAQQAQLHAAGNWINDFASQTDASGQPLYPHFDAVIEDIVFAVQHQVDRGQPVDVKAAYDRAVRLNDQIWLKDQAARSKDSSREALARRQREIEDAKRAGISVSGSGGASSDQPADSTRAELERLYDKYFP